MQDTNKRWRVVKAGALNNKVRLVGTEWNDLTSDEQHEVATEFKTHGTDGERGLFYLQLYAAMSSRT